MSDAMTFGVPFILSLVERKTKTNDYGREERRVGYGTGVETGDMMMGGGSG